MHASPGQDRAVTPSRVHGPTSEGRAWQLWDSLDGTTELFVLDYEGDWLDDARVRLLPDGGALYHDRVEGFSLLGGEELEQLWDLGALVRPEQHTDH